MNHDHAHPQSHALDTSNEERYRASRRVTITSVGTNLTLTIAQIIIGIIGHSQALVADAIHTLSDLVGDFMVLFALAHGRKAADEEHPYGHARIETAVTMLLGIILFTVGIGIAVRAGINLATATAFVTPAPLTLWTAIFTLAAKEGLYHYTMRTAKRFDSNMLRASAWHHRSDALSSFIVAAGIGGALAGFAYLDSVAAIVIAVMIVKVGVELAWQAGKELVDTGLAPVDIEAIRQKILSVSGVKALHLLRTRRVGGQALADVHIIVDDKISVSEGHQISETVRMKLIGENAPLSDVMVHIDTEEDTSGPSCANLPLRDKIQQRLDHYFRDIPESRHIRHTTLHYLNGHIDVEVLLPLAVVANSNEAQKLTQRMAMAVSKDQDIKTLDVRFC